MDAYATWWHAVVLGGAAYALAWACVWSVPAIMAQRNDVADVGWGLQFGFLALVTGGAVNLFDWRDETRATIVVVLVCAWGLRLALHIGRRVVAHDEEDKRYAKMRADWGGGRRPVRSLLQVFVLQAAIGLVVAQPVLIAASVHDGAESLGVLDLLGVVLVIAGTLLEATADRQLRRFLARRAAGEEQRRYLTTGVWAWSRHPNYAGDAITWWGFGLIGLAAVVNMGAWWLAIPVVLGPVVMTLFLRYGSGVPMTERGRAGHPEWDAYVERTAAFLPRPPR